MRTALLSAVKRTASGQLRAELDLAGRSVLMWQVELVRALGCQRIICLCDAPRDAILIAQQQVEAEGGEFHLARSNLQLVGLVRTDDELVMVADGLLIGRDRVEDMLSDAQVIERGVATIPANHRLAEAHEEDFERIDRDRHWAGLAVTGAGQVHKLADMPPDGDAMSMLLRLALQARTECRDWSERGLGEGNWLLADDQLALDAREKALIGASTASESVGAPFRALSTVLLGRIGARSLTGGPPATAAGGVAIMLAGLGAALSGFGSVGLGVAACGAFVAEFAGQWALLRERLWSQARGKVFEHLLPLGVEVIATACLLTAFMNEDPPPSAVALPVFAMALSYLAGRSQGTGTTIPFWHDRTLHLIAFAIAAALGYTGEALALFGLAALAQVILRSHRDPG